MQPKMQPSPRPMADAAPVRSLLISAAVGFDAFLFDRAHKFYQLDMMGWSGGEFVRVTGFLDYVMVWNRNVSLGILSALPQPLVFVIIGVAFASLSWWWLRADSFLTRIGLALALGGALSNIVDRLLYGAVADFFHLHFGQTSFFVFNTADAAITLGAVLLMLDVFLPGKVRKV